MTPLAGAFVTPPPRRAPLRLPLRQQAPAAPFVAGASARALEDVAHLLAREEGHETGRRTAEITEWVHETAKQFDDAPIQIYVPILVEHIVRARIKASRITISQA